MDKILKIVKYIVAMLPSMVTLTMIFIGILLLPTSLIPNLDIVISEIIYVMLLLIYGIRVSKKGIDKVYKWIYWIVGFLTTLLFFIWSKRILLIQPCHLLLYMGIGEVWLKDVRCYIKDNAAVFSWFNIFDCIFIGFSFLIRIDKNISNNIQSSILTVLESLNISSNYTDTFVLVLFLICWLLLVPAIRVGLGIHFFRKHNPISLPANHVLWGTYLSGYCLSLVSITSYLVFFFTVYEAKRNLVFILLVYNIYLSASTLYWVPVYTSLNKLGEEKDKLISDLILIVLIFVLLVLIDQIESEVIGILTWFLPVLLPNFIGEIYKISNDYQNNNNISPSKKMEKHIYWLTMLSFNTLVIFNVISAFSITDRGEHKFKQFLITIFSELLKSNAPPTFPLSLFSSLIIVLFSVFLAWWVSKCVIKLLKHIYLDPSKNYFDKL